LEKKLATIFAYTARCSHPQIRRQGSPPTCARWISSASRWHSSARSSSSFPTRTILVAIPRTKELQEDGSAPSGGLLADRSKVGVRYTFFFAGLDQVDLLITDATPEELEGLSIEFEVAERLEE